MFFGFSREELTKLPGLLLKMGVILESSHQCKGLQDMKHVERSRPYAPRRNRKLPQSLGLHAFLCLYTKDILFWATV